MKGGVTSGIVYPLAISRLSEEYFFKNIGGTSAGAIAAAAAAAAEYQRRKTGSDAGFKALDELPEELGAEDDTKQSKLFRLFRPQTTTNPLFSMLIAGLNRGSLLARSFHVVTNGLFSFWPYSGFGALVLGGLAWWCSGLEKYAETCESVACLTSWVPTVLLALVGAFIGLGFGIYHCLGKHVVNNGFGLCKGLGREIIGHCGQSGEEELTLWLNRLINRVAGLNPDGDPLTFGDLWNAPGFPPKWLHLPPGRHIKSIGLQMMTTNVTHGRPYTLPFDDSDARLFFRPDELCAYFPEVVVKWMKKNQGQYKRQGNSDPAALPLGLLQMPDAENLPIVVAARLSLSFPFLISAVPLWAIDYEARQGERTFQRCWFSDGGISSNFPVHLFDSLLPLWPTFGVKLEGFPKTYKDRIYMPRRNVEGRADGWNRFNEEKNGFARFKGFFEAIIDAMMNWNDNTLARIPGYRDRIVRIRLSPEEGGMNLNMRQSKIKMLSGFGNEAGKEIIRRFVNEMPTEPGGIPMGWENHRWVRLRSLIAILEETIPELQFALQTTQPGGSSYGAQVLIGPSRDPRQYPLDNNSQVTTITAALQQIANLASTITLPPPTSPSAPMPLPALRVRPKS